MTTMYDFSAESWMLCVVANVPPLLLACSVAGPPHRLRITARMLKPSLCSLPAKPAAWSGSVAETPWHEAVSGASWKVYK